MTLLEWALLSDKERFAALNRVEVRLAAAEKVVGAVAEWLDGQGPTQGMRDVFAAYQKAYQGKQNGCPKHIYWSGTPEDCLDCHPDLNISEHKEGK